MATSSPQINDLPVEMLVEILEKLPLPEIVTYCIKVCAEWKHAIAKYILRPKIENLADVNAMFKTAIEKEGWNEDVNEPDMIISLYQKYWVYWVYWSHSKKYCQ